MLFKTEEYVMPYIVAYSYPCIICSKDIKQGDKYTFIDPYTDDGEKYIRGGYTCLNEVCIQMRIFQMME